MSERIAEYEAEYFLPTVREVLDPLLAGEGLSYEGDHREVTAYWAAGDRFFRVGYLPETKPDYELVIGLGEADGSPLGPKSSTNSIGVWRLLPRDVAPQIADWRFHSPESLREELRRAWSEAVAPYVLPLLSKEHQLSQLIEEHNYELAEEDENLMQNRLLAYARVQFETGRFAEAIHAYDELGDEPLTRADRKRLEIARRRL
jgi:hypothetical protein